MGRAREGRTRMSLRQLRGCPGPWLTFSPPSQVISVEGKTALPLAALPLPSRRVPLSTWPLPGQRP